MILILGGRYQGKTAYALRVYGLPAEVFDLAAEEVSSMFKADVIINLQEGVRRLITQDICPEAYFQDNLGKLKDKILVGTEIGCGIVPIAEEERIWRDKTGRVYQILAQEAQKVERIWAGLPVTLKDSVAALRV